MTRLIVEEGGRTRAFKVGEGKLAIGSGAAAKLRLESEGVAEVHAELEIQSGVAILHVRPGVVPAKVGGLPTTGSKRIAPGVPITIGAATLRIESDAPQAAGAVRPEPVQRGAHSEHPPRKISHGVPTWAIVAPVFLILSGAFALMMRSVLTKKREPTANESEIYLNKALSAFDHNQLTDARLELARLSLEDLSPERRRKAEELRALLEADRQQADKEAYNLQGTEFLDEQIVRFELRYLKGVADPPKVRVFLKRIEEFKRRWPEHEKLPWVLRQAQRFDGVVDLSAAPSFEDIAFEVKSLTWAVDMRNYKEAFALMARFLEDCGPEERVKMAALMEEQRAEREKWFAERMERARWELEDGQAGRSAAWLVAVIRYAGNEEMAGSAARELVRFDDAEARLRGYREQKPEVWADLKANAVLAEFIKARGLPE